MVISSMRAWISGGSAAGAGCSCAMSQPPVPKRAISEAPERFAPQLTRFSTCSCTAGASSAQASGSSTGRGGALAQPARTRGSA